MNSWSYTACAENPGAGLPTIGAARATPDAPRAALVARLGAATRGWTRMVGFRRVVDIAMDVFEDGGARFGDVKGAQLRRRRLDLSLIHI